MKKIFTLSLVAASAVSAFAFQAKKSSFPTFAEARPAMSKVMSLADVKTLNMPAQETLASEAAASPYKAFYSLHGILPMGYDFGPEGFGYGYSTPYAAAPCFGAYCEGKYGTKWTVGTADTDITESITDNKYKFEGNIDKGYYVPKIWNGNDFYYYGCDGTKASVGYGIVFTGGYAADPEDLMTVGNYNVYANTTWYGGFVNTCAFGSRKFTTDNGTLVTSNSTMLEYEVPAGQSFVLDHIEFPFLNSDDENGNPYESAWEDENVTLEATIIEKTDVEGQFNTYHATISKSDIDTVGTDMRLSIYFTDIDEDGFESGISPVLHNDFQVVISGFARPGIHICIMMIYDASSYLDDATGMYVSDHGTHSYFDRYDNGVVVSDGSFFYDDRVEALVNLVGSYYTFCEYGTGETKLEGVVPFGSKEYTDEESGEKFCVAFSSITDSVSYNDFDLLTDATADEISVECEDPTLLGFDVDDEYFADQNAQMIYFYVKPLAEGEQAHTITGKLVTDIASIDFSIDVQDANSNSLNKVVVAEKSAPIFNLMGQQVKNTNAKGLYLINGKKVMK